jgi:RNA polymerase sigma factor (TIGR02999 family)
LTKPETKSDFFPMNEIRDLTVMLRRAQEGNQEVVGEIFDAVYEELHRMAQGQRLRWDGNYTVNTTVLVHEAYLKLVDQKRVRWEDRSHFFAVAAKAMRHILVNYAERGRAARRGGGVEPVPLEEGVLMDEGVAEEVLALNEALDHLAERSPRQAKVVELRFFVGLTIEEVAKAQEVSIATVKRDWQMASAWLRNEIKASVF